MEDAVIVLNEDEIVASWLAIDHRFKQLCKAGVAVTSEYMEAICSAKEKIYAALPQSFIQQLTDEVIDG